MLDSLTNSKCKLALWCFCISLSSMEALAESNVSVDSEIKTVANLIHKLAIYTSWPTTNEETFNVCMLHDRSSEFAIPEHMPGSISGRRIRYIFPQLNNEQDRHCDIFYFSTAYIADKYAEKYIRLHQNKPVLTISTLPRFVERGGGIGFVEKNGAIGIEVNLKALRATGLVLDPAVLENARRVIQ